MTPQQREAALRLADNMDLPLEAWMDQAATMLRELAAEPQGEPAAWIQPDHLQKARVAPFLCRVEPTKRMSDFVPLYAHPPQQRKPLSEEQMKEVMSAAGVRVFQPGLWDVLVEAGRSIERHYGIGEAP